MQTTFQHLIHLSWVHTTLALLALGFLSWMAAVLALRLMPRLMRGIIEHTRWRWEDALLKRGIFRWVARIAPVLVMQQGIELVPGLPARVLQLVSNVTEALLTLFLVMALSCTLLAFHDLYRETPRGRQRSIKGIVQLVNIGLFIIAGLLIITLLTGERVGLLLSGLGAMSAVLILIFKDTILGFVAGLQLSANDMLRVGDWIEMPQLNANGNVIDIALHSVKVRNFDKTITTIPSWRLISDSYKNWRGMNETGGRRIKRALFIDATSVRFLPDDKLDQLSHLSLLADYIQTKQQELERRNRALGDAGKTVGNHYRLTNLGTLRAYVLVYLQNHPRIHHTMTCMVRQLDSSPQGIPIELYCFTTTVVWDEYEGIQSDIFDHLFAILPEFGLRLYQQPSGYDMQTGLMHHEVVDRVV